MELDRIVELFGFMYDRQLIWHNRFTLKLPRGQWCNEDVFRKYRFCNVFRKLDKGTQYIIEEVIDNKDLDDNNKLFNIIFYRFLNRYKLFEIIGGYLDIYNFDPNKYIPILQKLKDEGVTFYGDAYDTRARIIKGIDTTVRHEQHLIIMDRVAKSILGNDIIKQMKEAPGPGDIIELLKVYDNVGAFLAYEIYCDLTYSDLIKFTEDDYVNVGPGTILAIDYILTGNLGNDYKVSYKNDVSLKLIYDLRDNQDKYLGLLGKDLKAICPDWYKALTLRDIEHCLCEFRKYLTTKAGYRKGKLYRQILNVEVQKLF